MESEHEEDGSSIAGSDVEVDADSEVETFDASRVVFVAPLLETTPIAAGTSTRS